MRCARPVWCNANALQPTKYSSFVSSRAVPTNRSIICSSPECSRSERKAFQTAMDQCCVGASIRSAAAEKSVERYSPNAAFDGENRPGTDPIEEIQRRGKR